MGIYVPSANPLSEVDFYLPEDGLRRPGSVNRALKPLADAVARLELAGTLPIVTTPTVSSPWEVVYSEGGTYLQLSKPTTWATTRTRTLGVGSEWGDTYTNVNSTNLNSLVDNSPVAGALNFSHKAITTAWNASTRTAASLSRTFRPRRGRAYFIARVTSSATTNNQLIGLMASQASDPTKLSGIWAGYYSGAPGVESYSHLGTSFYGFAAGYLAAGVWMALTLDSNWVVSSYNLSASTTLPSTGWVDLVARQPWTTWRTDFIIHRLSLSSVASPSFTAQMRYYEEDIGDADRLGSNVYTYGTTGYTAGALALVADWPVGQNALSDARMRSSLAGVLNSLHPLSAATWSVSAVRSDSPGATVGTYRPLASATIDGSGRYLSVWVQPTTDGTAPASIGPFPFALSL